MLGSAVFDLPRQHSVLFPGPGDIHEPLEGDQPGEEDGQDAGRSHRSHANFEKKVVTAHLLRVFNIYYFFRFI